jgi:hypothetical protein
VNFDLTAEQIELRDHVAAFARDESHRRQPDPSAAFPRPSIAEWPSASRIPFDAEFGGGARSFE